MKELLYLLLVLQINLVFPQNFAADFAAKIHQQVQDQLRKSQGIHETIVQNLRQNLPALQNIPISEKARQQMLPLQNIGIQIRESLRKTLLPIRAMNIRNSMKNGVGGTTVVTYDSGRVFIIENGVRFTCNGNIVGGQCDNPKDQFQISSRQDHCYAPSYAEVSDKICLSTNSLNVENFNGQVSCRSSDGSEVLTLTKQEYQTLCGQPSPSKATYEYYPKPNDPNAITIPNSNPHVTCLNNEPNYCKFADAGTVSGSGTTMNTHSSNQNGVSNYSNGFSSNQNGGGLNNGFSRSISSYSFSSN